MNQIQPILPGIGDFETPLPAEKAILREAMPAYRVAHHLQGCSILDLLAVIIGGQKGNRIARDLAAQYDLDQLGRSSVHELAQLNGIGQTTAARLIAALELGRRALQPHEQMATIRSPADAAGILMPKLSGLSQEHFVVIGLDTRNRVRFIETLYIGNVNTSIVRAAEVFARAVRGVLPAILIAHNHPSGQAEPSPEDISISRTLVKAGRLLDVDLLDHIIVGQGRTISLKERGFLT